MEAVLPVHQHLWEVNSTAQNVQGGAASLADDVQSVMEIVTDVENKIENKIEEGSQALTQLMDAMNDITDKSNRISAVNNIGEFTTNTQATSEECFAIS